MIGKVSPQSSCGTAQLMCRYGAAETAEARDRQGLHQYFSLSDTTLDESYRPRLGHTITSGSSVQ